MNVSTFIELDINPGDDEESNSDGKNHLEHQTQQLGSTLEEVANVPKVKLQISSGPLPPIQDYPELPYGRRKRRRPGEENQENWQKVPLILSAKRIHPGTKQNNLLLEPLAEIQDPPDEKKPDVDRLPKYRRKRRINSNLTNQG